MKEKDLRPTSNRLGPGFGKPVPEPPDKKRPFLTLFGEPRKIKTTLIVSKEALEAKLKEATPPLMYLDSDAISASAEATIGVDTALSIRRRLLDDPDFEEKAAGRKPAKQEEWDEYIKERKGDEHGSR